MKTVLVTGGAGFIGSHVIDRLLERGHRVICLDTFDDFYARKTKEENLRLALGKAGFTLVEGDILDTHLLQALFAESRIDYVVHLAARAGVRPSVEQPGLYEKTNVLGTINLLEACKGSGIQRFLFGSSSSVYGANAQAPFREEVKIDRPASPYAASKAAGELYCSVYNHLYGIPIVALRFFTVYGPRQRPDLAIYKFTQLIYQGQEVPVYGTGNSVRDFTYISDIVDGVEAALTAPIEGFEAINLGASRTVELLYVIKLISQNLGKEARLKFLPPQPGDVPLTHADVSKAARLLGYRPKVTIEEGIRRFVQWFLESRVSVPSTPGIEVT